ncbi:protein transporter tim10 [Serendipita sp. 396]|nr:protein transporter tim10 [Serendipita sp. 396]KAG8785084.1 protein transporter tim10 [Serendipita sp. 397]KAG8869847.1 protein transporter tim10 [Serendipita sp. 405]
MAFGLGNTPTPSSSGGVNSERVEAAIVELDMVTDVFNRMVASCASKCLSQRYAEGDLTKGESVCIDRCVGKFLEANKIIGEKLKESGGSMNPGGF